jgi:hypothetical protein
MDSAKGLTGFQVVTAIFLSHWPAFSPTIRRMVCAIVKTITYLCSETYLPLFQSHILSKGHYALFPF